MLEVRNRAGRAPKGSKLVEAKESRMPKPEAKDRRWDAPGTVSRGVLALDASTIESGEGYGRKFAGIRREKSPKWENDGRVGQNSHQVFPGGAKGSLSEPRRKSRRRDKMNVRAGKSATYIQRFFHPGFGTTRRRETARLRKLEKATRVSPGKYLSSTSDVGGGKAAPKISIARTSAVIVGRRKYGVKELMSKTIRTRVNTENFALI